MKGVLQMDWNVEKHFNGCNLKGAFTNGLKCENFNNGCIWTHLQRIKYGSFL